jgi:hypothetical protein
LVEIELGFQRGLHVNVGENAKAFLFQACDGFSTAASNAMSRWMLKPYMMISPISKVRCIRARRAYA